MLREHRIGDSADLKAKCQPKMMKKIERVTLKLLRKSQQEQVSRPYREIGQFEIVAIRLFIPACDVLVLVVVKSYDDSPATVVFQPVYARMNCFQIRKHVGLLTHSIMGGYQLVGKNVTV